MKSTPDDFFFVFEWYSNVNIFWSFLEKTAFLQFLPIFQKAITHSKVIQSTRLSFEYIKKLPIKFFVLYHSLIIMSRYCQKPDFFLEAISFGSGQSSKALGVQAFCESFGLLRKFVEKLQKEGFQPQLAPSPVNISRDIRKKIKIQACDQNVTKQPCRGYVY